MPRVLLFVLVALLGICLVTAGALAHPSLAFLGGAAWCALILWNELAGEDDPLAGVGDTDGRVYGTIGPDSEDD